MRDAESSAFLRRAPSWAGMDSDPLVAIDRVVDLWLEYASIFTLYQCSAVSHSWRDAARTELRAKRTLAISSKVDGNILCGRTNDRVLRSILCTACQLTELHLHGLSFISDDALYGLAQHPIRIAGFTYCTSLTASVRYYLPSTVADLRIAGCHRAYPDIAHLQELDGITLDIHVCAPAVQEVEAQARGGFRYVDPAMRLGVRQGAVCSCRSPTSKACSPIPDVRGACRVPELWHASSFDWQPGLTCP